jgi:hypothetical protein
VFFISAFSTTMQYLRALLAPSGHPSVLFLLLYNIRPRVQILAEHIEHKKSAKRLEGWVGMPWWMFHFSWEGFFRIWTKRRRGFSGKDGTSCSEGRLPSSMTWLKLRPFSLHSSTGPQAHPVTSFIWDSQKGKLITSAKKHIPSHNL